MTKDGSAGLVAPDALVDLLATAGVDRSSLIRVTGRCALPTLLWLCRHGYQQVGCIRSGDGPPHEDPDALLVAHACNELELKHLLPTARHVRPGGVLICALRGVSPQDALAAAWLLAAAGFACERRLDGQRRSLVIARRRSQALRAA